MLGDPAAHAAQDASAARTGDATRETGRVVHVSMILDRPAPHIGDAPGCSLRVGPGSGQG